MRIYYVVPPAGVTFRSQADAQAAFEGGQVWTCIGWTYIEGGHVRGGLRKSPIGPVPARYSECHYHGEGEDVISVPKAWAMVWAPGRVSALRYVARPGQRKVSYEYGKGRKVDLLEERETKAAEKFNERWAVKSRLIARKAELANYGGWATSSGLRFWYDHEIHWMRRPDRERRKPVVFNPDTACRTVGDRELELYFGSAQHRAYNHIAAEKRQELAMPSDDVLDPKVRYFPVLV